MAVHSKKQQIPQLIYYIHAQHSPDYLLPASAAATTQGYLDTHNKNGKHYCHTISCKLAGASPGHCYTLHSHTVNTHARGDKSGQSTTIAIHQMTH
mmetsp:Transcript_71665/g.120107  ORF Transcript_71665/g.120107 Transcript_71665/m.120107 type:complete len:96 (-) Transcript_71665:845-1132(-)